MKFCNGKGSLDLEIRTGVAGWDKERGLTRNGCKGKFYRIEMSYLNLGVCAYIYICQNSSDGTLKIYINYPSIQNTLNII